MCLGTCVTCLFVFYGFVMSFIVLLKTMIDTEQRYQGRQIEIEHRRHKIRVKKQYNKSRGRTYLGDCQDSN